MSTPLRPEERAYTLSTRAGWDAFVNAPPRQRPEPLTHAQIRKLTEPARLEYEEQRSVWHANIGPLRTPQMRAVHEHLDDIVEANRQDGDKVKGAAVIDAYPGLGKSTIAQVFARGFHQRQVSLYGPVTGAGHDRVPVVYVCLTSSTSKRSFNAMLCRFFGLPGHDRGNAEELGHRAADAVLACDVRLCLLMTCTSWTRAAATAGTWPTISSTWPTPSPSRSSTSGSGWNAAAWSARAWPPGKKN